MSEPVPEVSVIIPAKNADATIAEQLEALCRQDTTLTFEVIVVDDQSTDDTCGAARAFTGRLPSLRLLRTVDRTGHSHGRNVGASHSAGRSLLFLDADDVADEGYVQAMGVALRDSPMVGGMLSPFRTNSRKVSQDSPSLQSAVSDGMYGWLPWISAGVLGISADLFDRLGGFDESLSRTEDPDLGWRASIAGVTMAAVPDAVLHYRLRAGIRSTFWQSYSNGLEAPLLYKRYRYRGMPRHTARAMIRFWAGALTRCTRCRTLGDMEGCAALLGLRVGLLRGSIRHRVMYS
ncbi:MAG: glycosyltransferase [Acidimicrobiales bacterium]